MEERQNSIAKYGGFIKGESRNLICWRLLVIFKSHCYFIPALLHNLNFFTGSKLQMRKPQNKVLINPTREQILEQEPLKAYSHYLSGRVNVLLTISEEIRESLNDCFSTECLNHGQLQRAESLMWLWIFGAYEIVRTMCQSKSCFTEQIFHELSKLKKRLSSVRMPAAKMEKPGTNPKRPVTSNRSPCGIDPVRKDLRINEPRSNDVFARDILNEFEQVFSSIKVSDVLYRHEYSYQSDV